MQIEKAYLFGRQLSAGAVPPSNKSYLFNNGRFNKEWVPDDFSLSNYQDVVGSASYGNRWYMESNFRRYYFGDMTSYANSGDNLYVRDTGSGLCTLSQDDTLIIDTTQCSYERTDVQYDCANMFCIRLREDHPTIYDRIHIVFRLLEGNRTSKQYQPQINYDVGYGSSSSVSMYLCGGADQLINNPTFPTDWIDIGGIFSIPGSLNVITSYARINTIALSRMEVKEIYFKKEDE